MPLSTTAIVGPLGAGAHSEETCAASGQSWGFESPAWTTWASSTIVRIFVFFLSARICFPVIWAVSPRITLNWR